MSKQSNKYIDNAVKALSLLEVSIGRWTGVAKLNKGAAKAAQDVGANQQAARLYVDLLGKHHRKLKKVNAAYAAIRTYLYDHTLPFAANNGGQTRGPRLLPVVRVPEVYGKLKELAAEAEQELEAFLKEYDRLRAIAMSEDMGGWLGELQSEDKYPSVADIRSRFRCIICPPRPIPNDAKGIQNMGLPIGMAADFASQHYDLIDDQLRHAKDAAVQQAKEQMATVEKQLRDGKRLHDSLISNSARVARLLKDMVQGYDNDPRLIALADEIERQIAGVKDTEKWRNSPALREQSAKVAKVVRQSLAAYAAGKPMPSAPAVKKPAPATSKPVAKGLIGKKRAARKAAKTNP